eukprot:gene13216-15617_t
MSVAYTREKVVQLCSLCETCNDSADLDELGFDETYIIGFGPNDVHITESMNFPYVAHLSVNLPDEVGGRGEIVCLQFDITVGYDHDVRTDLPANTVTHRQAVYMSVFSQNSKLMRAKVGAVPFS